MIAGAPAGFRAMGLALNPIALVSATRLAVRDVGKFLKARLV